MHSFPVCKPSGRQTNMSAWARNEWCGFLSVCVCVLAFWLADSAYIMQLYDCIKQYYHYYDYVNELTPKNKKKIYTGKNMNGFLCSHEWTSCGILCKSMCNLCCCCTFFDRLCRLLVIKWCTFLRMFVSGRDGGDNRKTHAYLLNMLHVARSARCNLYVNELVEKLDVCFFRVYSFTMKTIVLV